MRRISKGVNIVRGCYTKDNYTPDVVTVDYDSITVFLNNNNSFPSSFVLTDGLESILEMICVDITGNGLQDAIVVGEEYNGLQLFQNSSAGWINRVIDDTLYGYKAMASGVRSTH